MVPFTAPPQACPSTPLLAQALAPPVKHLLGYQRAVRGYNGSAPHTGPFITLPTLLFSKRSENQARGPRTPDFRDSRNGPARMGSIEPSSSQLSEQSIPGFSKLLQPLQNPFPDNGPAAADHIASPQIETFPVNYMMLSLEPRSLQASTRPTDWTHTSELEIVR